MAKASSESTESIQQLTFLKKCMQTNPTAFSVAGSPLLKSRVQLHIHLDGAIRVDTLFDVMERRGVARGVGGIQQLREKVVPVSGVSLIEYLKPFDLVLEIVGGDEEALKRIGYEFVEDQAREGVLYAEVRYSPHFLRGEKLTAHQVAEAVTSGIEAGCKAYPDVTVKSILCTIKVHPEWTQDCVDIAAAFKARGVVAIDIAGDELSGNFEDHQAAFLRAKELGIHRTVHAGESGPSSHVSQVLDLLHAERIGHGYASVNDEALLQRIVKEKVHLEMCPISSLLTGSAQIKGSAIRTLALAGASFSINTDDPLMNDACLSHDYEFSSLCLGLPHQLLTQSNFMALNAAFIPEEEKSELRERLEAAYTHLS